MKYSIKLNNLSVVRLHFSARGFFPHIGTNKITDFVDKMHENSYNTIWNQKSKKELLWPLPGMHIITKEYLKSFYFNKVKRTTAWPIAVFVNIYIDFVT